MVLRGGPRGRVGHRRTYLKRVAPVTVERPSSFVWVLSRWRLVRVAEGSGAPRGRGARGGRASGGGSRGAKTSSSSGGARSGVSRGNSGRSPADRASTNGASTGRSG